MSCSRVGRARGPGVLFSSDEAIGELPLLLLLSSQQNSDYSDRTNEQGICYSSRRLRLFLSLPVSSSHVPSRPRQGSPHHVTWPTPFVSPFRLTRPLCANQPMNRKALDTGKEIILQFIDLLVQMDPENARRVHLKGC